MGLAFLISTDNVQLLTDRKLLKESEYKVLADGSAVVEAARQEARRVVRQSTQEADEARRQGYLDGLAQARAEYAERLLQDARDTGRQLQALRQVMAGIVVKAVRQLLVTADAQALLEAALRQVDGLVRHESFLTVWVAPVREAILRAALDRLRSDANWSNVNVSVMTDASMSPGSCIVQTPSGSMEIGLDAQLSALKKAVERAGLVAHE